MKSVSSGPQVMTDNYNMFKYWPGAREGVLCRGCCGGGGRNNKYYAK